MSSSSDEDDMSKFAAVAVTGQEIASNAETSAKEAQRKAIKAAQRRAGGGGLRGVTADSDSDCEMLDAAQLRVAEALKKRLENELEVDENRALPAEGNSPADEASEGGGVALFKNAPRLNQVPIATSKVVLRKNSASRARPKRLNIVPTSSDEEGEAERRCAVAAVDASGIVEGAERAAAAAKANIAPLEPGSEDEGGKAKQRKRRKTTERKAAAEAEAGAAKGGQEQKIQDADGPPEQGEKKKKKKGTKERTTEGGARLS